MKKTLLLLLTAAALPASALADTWPQRPIKMVVPAAAGGSTDQGARMIARLMSTPLGQPVVVDNKGGGGGRIAPNEVARSAPDGYTVLFGNSIGNALLPAVVTKLSYDPLKDFKPVGVALSYATVLTCNKQKGLLNFEKFKAYAQSNPGKINMANAGPGSGNHFASALLAQRLNLEFTHVPYRGNAPAVQDILAGSADCIFMTEGKPFIDSDQLVALATTSAGRDPRFPKVPTLQELGVKEYEMTFWQGVFVPSATPDAVVNKLSTALQTAVKQLSENNLLQDAGFVPHYMAPAETMAKIRDDMKAYKAIAQAAKIVIE